MTGQISVESDKTLLSLIDDAKSSLNASFNSSVIQKALKAHVYDDLKLCEFQRLATTTYQIIEARYITDEEGTIDSQDPAQTFFASMCAQVLIKLIKSVGPKLKSKETSVYVIQKRLFAVVLFLVIKLVIVNQVSSFSNFM